MRKEIHPNYAECAVVCSCGNSFTTRSTKANLRIELCNLCHPFYTGQQKFVDTGGRVQRFADKFGSASATVVEKEDSKRKARLQAAAEAESAAKAAREEKASKKAAKAAKFAEKAEKAEKAAAKKPVAEEASAELASELDETLANVTETPAAGEAVEEKAVSEESSAAEAPNESPVEEDSADTDASKEA